MFLPVFFCDVRTELEVFRFVFLCIYFVCSFSPSACVLMKKCKSLMLIYNNIYAVLLQPGRKSYRILLSLCCTVDIVICNAMWEKKSGRIKLEFTDVIVNSKALWENKSSKVYFFKLPYLCYLCILM